MESCNCKECISACHNDPGRLVPEDLARIATHLGYTNEELLEGYLVKIDILKGQQHAFALAPAKRKGKNFVAEPGTVAPDYYTEEQGICIFLDEKDHCSIHTVKPYECGAYMGCTHTFNGRPYREKQVEEYFFSRWKNYKG